MKILKIKKHINKPKLIVIMLMLLSMSLCITCSYIQINIITSSIVINLALFISIIITGTFSLICCAALE